MESTALTFNLKGEPYSNPGDAAAHIASIRGATERLERFAHGAATSDRHVLNRGISDLRGTDGPI